MVPALANQIAQWWETWILFSSLSPLEYWEAV